MHIFISYSKKESKALARHLRDSLIQLDGVTAWMDEALEPGKSWPDQIEKQIDRSDCVIVILSPDVNRPETDDQSRSFVLTETNFALENKKQILPVMAKPTKIPLALSGKHYIDFTEDVEKGMQELIQYICKMAALPLGEEVPAKALLPHDSRPVKSDRLLLLEKLLIVMLLGTAAAASLSYLISLVWFDGNITDLTGKPVFGAIFLFPFLLTGLIIVGSYGKQYRKRFWQAFFLSLLISLIFPVMLIEAFFPGTDFTVMMILLPLPVLTAALFYLLEFKLPSLKNKQAG